MQSRTTLWALPTFDDADELLHVVVCFPVVNHRSNGEDQLGLNLREPVENTLQASTAAERSFKTRQVVQKISVSQCCLPQPTLKQTARTEQLQEDSRESKGRVTGGGHLHRQSFEL